jgi:hypothetical protein
MIQWQCVCFWHFLVTFWPLRRHPLETSWPGCHEVHHSFTPFSPCRPDGSKLTLGWCLTTFWSLFEVVKMLSTCFRVVQMSCWPRRRVFYCWVHDDWSTYLYLPLATYLTSSDAYLTSASSFEPLRRDRDVWKTSKTSIFEVWRRVFCVLSLCTLYFDLLSLSYDHVVFVCVCLLVCCGVVVSHPTVVLVSTFEPLRRDVKTRVLVCFRGLGVVRRVAQ